MFPRERERERKAEKVFERFSKPIPEDAELVTVSFGPAAALRWAFEDLELDILFTELFDSEEGHDFPAWKKIYLLVWRRFFQNLSMREAVERYGKQIFPFWWREDVTTVQRLYQFLGEEFGEEKVKEAQEKLVRRAVAGDGVEECCFDTTDYCTYVEDDTKYLRIGRSKEGVVGRRLVGLALALNNQGVPVFGEAYPGNRNDVDLFPGLFKGVCERLEAAGSDLENVTLIFDRGFDGKDNFEMAWQSPLNIVAAVKRNRKTVREVLDSLELEEFQKSYETSYGECYVYGGGRVDIGEHSWRVVLSYHDSTREKVREKMDEQRQEAEEVLTESLNRLERGGPGRPPTENSVRKKLEKILGKRYHCLDWSLDPKAKNLDWRWTKEWDRKYELAGILPIITDQDDWTPDKVAKTYFQRKDIEDMFHLTKKALIVPVEPPYVKGDHLIRAHLFLTFIGLLCYQHIKRKLHNTMTDDDIKSAMKELDMVVATEDGSLQFKLANVNEETRPLLTAVNLEKYLPE
ncbi:hypothetical protein AKJ62_03550 [candidate division MSBL1 archaeon SCGC-AAA259D14]|uniref:Transposase IS4-like domain-containing protein n=1 Tax=candidate division MSBL1 archaeon SCGC-AAA259D14 TaxID=1698261 RepID=A0A133U4V4_9EURY|nr:hypothetical protein AKJ62_03550 [candidate division MSBL1 archaeon SCGC-AAA259D14]